ncbi:MAG: hypothetical protein WCT36_03925 [Candidatus Gracilibacteria bacterium]|jgi:hypothetical protein
MANTCPQFVKDEEKRMFPIDLEGKRVYDGGRRPVTFTIVGSCVDAIGEIVALTSKCFRDRCANGGDGCPRRKE